ncbi:MAG: hydantoinase/carbamoylase family amidase [Chloroflexi bacterium]|nr:hydantoinase/carbamoylase family amidase [Chloroflexota bacterium]
MTYDPSGLDPQRTIRDLKELRALTGDENGAQRVAFTDTWIAARKFMREKLADLPIKVQVDEAGNQWATLPGKSDDALLIGGHIDSVPNGGWLDGCLNLLAGIEVLRHIASLAPAARPPFTIRLVDWADEEGARFGRSLFGSSSTSGHMNPDDLRDLKDKDGIRLQDALERVGINIDRALDAKSQLQDAKAYLELHIEQGPVLESKNLAMGTVLGTYGVERHSIRFVGQAAHAGSTPMHMRRDALAAAARLELEIREIAIRNGGVCTMGRVDTKPGIVTSVVETCDCLLDQRHLDAGALATMLREAKEASEKFAQQESVSAAWTRLWQIEPILFHEELRTLTNEAIQEVTGASFRLPSGPLHDAAEVARAGVPTVMLFVQSLRGLSHTKLEDTKEEHLALSVEALDRLAYKAMEWIQQRTK